MSITGSLSDFSFPEILQLIEQGCKTGLLTVHTLSESQASQSTVYYIWVYQGNLVAAANQLDQQGLVKLLEQYQVVSDRVLDKLVHWCCPLDKPLGLYLKNQGVLRTEHLQELFLVQVLQPVYALFQAKEGMFNFDANVPIPTRELTGLSISAGVPRLFATPLEVLGLDPDSWKLSLAARNREVHSPPEGKNTTPSRGKSLLGRVA